MNFRTASPSRGNGSVFRKYWSQPALRASSAGGHPRRLDDHPRLRQLLALPDFPAELQPVEAGHLDVGHHHRGERFLDAFPGDVAILGFDHLVAIELY